MSEECPQCYGNGWWSSGCDGQVECNTCLGKGYLGDCPPCFGSGKVVKKKSDLTGINDYDPVCPQCEGTGGKRVIPPKP